MLSTLERRETRDPAGQAPEWGAVQAGEEAEGSMGQAVEVNVLAGSQRDLVLCSCTWPSVNNNY